MLLKEVFGKRKEGYDPVSAHVPGVDEEQRRLLIQEFINGGDPMPKTEPPKEKIIFQLPGIRLVKTIRVK